MPTNISTIASEEEIEKLLRLRDQKEKPTAPSRQPKLTEADLLRYRDENFDGCAAPVGVPLEIQHPGILFTMLFGNEIKLYKWQAEELMRIAGYLDGTWDGTYHKATDAAPLLLAICAANGSGKDQIILATAAVWFAMKGLYNRFIITTASREQAKLQTEPGIKEVIKRVNALGLLPGKPMFSSIEFYHFCHATSGEIKIFVTDEPGRAEGYHPRVGGQMALAVNEAKSVPDEIFDAQDRCTGYSLMLHVSSPGKKAGRFYRNYLTADHYNTDPARGTVLTTARPNKWFFRRIPASECPNISSAHIERMKETKEQWWIDSSLNAEFYDAVEHGIIPHDYVLKSNSVKVFVPGQIGIGYDSAASQDGDEHALYVRVGNLVKHRYFFKKEDTVKSGALVHQWLIGKGYHPDNENISFNADAGGPGKGTLDVLRTYGWRINRIFNNNKPLDRKAFKNRGIEMYWHLRLLLQHGCLMQSDVFADQKLVTQLTTRTYTTDNDERLVIQPKEDFIQQLGESPDRADALVLACCSYRPAVLRFAKGKTPQPVAGIGTRRFANRNLIFLTDDEYGPNPNQQPSRLHIPVNAARVVR